VCIGSAAASAALAATLRALTPGTDHDEAEALATLRAAARARVLAQGPTPDQVAEAERARAAAIATDCGIEGCDRSGHDVRLGRADEWAHRIMHTKHVGLEVDVFAESDGIPRAYAYQVLDDGEGRDAEGVRQLATQLRIQAEQLIETADIMDRRARRLHRPADAVDALLDLEG
jgi:hypothetical protein